MNKFKYILTGALTALAPLILQAQSIRQNFDLGWQFSENEGSWQQVDLPHDWDISHAPKTDAPTGNDGGYYPAGYGCYKKTFAAPILKQGDALKLHFDGVYQNCEVYINGQLAGRHGYGYTPFHIDITRLIKSGQNEVEVRVDNTLQPSCRWYSGSGIYRHVWRTPLTTQRSCS